MADVQGYEEIKDGELLKWDEEGKVLEGVLHGYKMQRTAKGDGHVYQVKTKEAIIPFFAPMLLHEKLQNIPMGKIVKITYVKVTKTGGGTDLKHFEVLYADPTEANLNQVGVNKYTPAQGNDEGENVEGLNEVS